MVGHTTKVEERTTIKKSVIGKHCIIGKMVKIVGCIILDHCVIADGCVMDPLASLFHALIVSRAKLDGCILGINTKVGAKAELSRCVTQAGYEVDAGGSYNQFPSRDCMCLHVGIQLSETFRNDKLEVADWTAAQGSSDDDEVDGSDEESDS